VETQLAADDQTVYAAIVNLPVTYVTQEKTKIDFTGGTGEVVALDLKTGAVRWRTKLPHPAYGAATISNDLLFTTSFDGRLLALDKVTGQIVWRLQLPTATNATVAIAGDTLATAASFPTGKGRKPEIIVFRIGANGTLAPPTPPATTTTTQTTRGGGAALGRQVFTQNCGSCHTLAAAGTSGTIGPNLDTLHPSEAVVERQVRNGGPGMPAFEGQLTDAQIKAVARFVATKANPAAAKPGGAGKTP
jgi:mono/diheme cytochrome c family protein